MTVASINLGPRLRTVAEYVPQGVQLGDIGTDHAYLPIYLFETGKIKKAVAVDVHEGPYRSAEMAVASRALQEVIHVRLGDGLKPLSPGEVNAITLAGMGGKTMLEILAGRPDVLAQVDHLVLQPQGYEAQVRKTLLAQGWRMIDECLVEEERRIYVVISFSRQSGRDLFELEEKVRATSLRLRVRAKKDKAGIASQFLIIGEDFDQLSAKIIWQIGPVILHKAQQGDSTMLVHTYVSDMIDQFNKQMTQMSKAESKSVREKLNLVRQGKAILEGILQCL